MHKDVEEILITNEQIIDRCKELGKVLTKDYEGKTPIFVGLLKGAIPFYAELIKYIECDMETDFIDVSSYNGTESTGKVTFLKDVSSNIEGRHIVFVEDIIDTGLTLDEVVKVFKARNIASYEIVTMIDKPEGRKINTISPKYVGFNIPKKFVIGFGLDYNELYRNLPYVGVLKRSVYEK